jgi:RimJ/RimL family protein N-acetyltransferase
VSTATVERIQTGRLVCERLRANHGDELATLLLDPRVGATVWARSGPPTRAEVMDSLAAKIEHWERYGFGMWLLRDRRSREMVGRGGLQWTYIAGMKRVEAGWAIVPDRWGQGLATELAQACVEVAFGRLGLSEIVAFALADNIASRRVMEKAGFTYDRAIMHAERAHVLYRRRAGGARA